MMHWTASDEFQCRHFPLPATAWAEGRQFNGAPSLWAASYPHLFICEGDGRIMQYMVVRSLRC